MVNLQHKLLGGRGRGRGRVNTNTLFTCELTRVSFYARGNVLDLLALGFPNKSNIFYIHQELESSEEEEGISDAEFKKTKGWKLLMEALDSKFERKHQAKP